MCVCAFVYVDVREMAVLCVEFVWLCVLSAFAMWKVFASAWLCVCAVVVVCVVFLRLRC